MHTARCNLNAPRGGLCLRTVANGPVLPAIEWPIDALLGSTTLSSSSRQGRFPKLERVDFALEYRDNLVLRRL